LLERRIVEAGVAVQAAAVGPRRDSRAVRMAQAMLVTLQGMRADFPSVQATGGLRLERCAYAAGRAQTGRCKPCACQLPQRALPWSTGSVGCSAREPRWFVLAAQRDRNLPRVYRNVLYATKG
jgi:hypothetical protein